MLYLLAVTRQFQLRIMIQIIVANDCELSLEFFINFPRYAENDFHFVADKTVRRLEALGQQERQMTSEVVSMITGRQLDYTRVVSSNQISLRAEIYFSSREVDHPMIRIFSSAFTPVAMCESVNGEVKD